MSIATKTGDGGATGLMFNRRVSKADSRIEACGAVDELMAALGWARAHAKSSPLRKSLLATQKELILIMGSLSTLPEDRARYLESGFKALDASHVSRLDAEVVEIEGALPPFRDWVLPGESVPSAALDVARVACRRAERVVCGLMESAAGPSLGEIVRYLNRLSDLLWLMARWTDRELSESGGARLA